MAAPIVKLPYQFNGLSLSKVAADLAAHAVNGWPPEVIIDFGNLGFVRPAGIVFLSNLFAWMSAHQTKITLTNLSGNGDAVRFLDDSCSSSSIAAQSSARMHHHGRQRDH